MALIILSAPHQLLDTVARLLYDKGIMGLFQFISNILVGNKVISGLKNNCPDSIKPELQTLLSNKESVAIIRRFLIDTMKSGNKIQANSLTSLPFPTPIKEMLTATPKLATYIVLAIRMAGKK